MNLFDLTGKVALITGASSGLGKDAAWAYAEHGADLAILARREDRLQELAKEISEKTGRRVLPIKCDVLNEDEVKEAVDKIIKEYGKVDILLNNAGIAFIAAVDSMEMSEWDRGMDTNVKSVFLMSKYVLPHMMEANYGKIINIASINARFASKQDRLARHVYNSSKAAVHGLTIGMAATYMKNGITVNSVGPALFATEMTERTLMTDAFLQVYNQICPAGRPANKGELNGTLLYLSSDASSYVTGQFILVDGGFSLV